MRGWGIFRIISRLVAGGAGELGRPDLMRRTVSGVLKLRHRGDHGTDVFPAEVEVRICVGDGSVEVVRRFVSDPTFDREVGASLANQVLNLDERGLPIRRYAVEGTPPGSPTQFDVLDSVGPMPFELHVKAGDCAGFVFSIPSGARELVFGRREKVVEFDELPIDFAIPTTSASVSRRAGRLCRAGSNFEVETLHQGRNLVVRRPGDTRGQLPYNSSTKRIPLRPDQDELVFTDGRGGEVLILELRSKGSGDAGNHTRS